MKTSVEMMNDLVLRAIDAGNTDYALIVTFVVNEHEVIKGSTRIPRARLLRPVDVTLQRLKRQGKVQWCGKKDGWRRTDAATA